MSLSAATTTDSFSLSDAKNLNCAVKYLGDRATWCKGGCGRFRVPKCYWNEKPVCANCSVSLKLHITQPAQSAEVVLARHTNQPKTKKYLNVVKTGKVKNHYQSDQEDIYYHFSYFWIKLYGLQYQIAIFLFWYAAIIFKPDKRVASQILSMLNNHPMSSESLAKHIGCRQPYLIKIATGLVKSGKLIFQRERSQGAKYWYALPHHKERLSRLDRQGITSESKITDLFLASLANGVKTSCELEFDLNYTRIYINQTARRLEKQGKICVLREQGSLPSYYCLPEHKEQLKSSALTALILNKLWEVGPSTSKELLNHLNADAGSDKYNIKWIGNCLWRMANRGNICAEGGNSLRMYSLPHQHKALQDKVIYNSKATKIIDCLKESPGLYKRAIERKTNMSHRTVETYLDRLTRLNIIKEELISNRLIYTLCL